MYFEEKIAQNLQVLINPDVEKALMLLLDTFLEQQKAVLENSEADYGALKQYQGQYRLIQELKEYKQRLMDVFNGR